MSATRIAIDARYLKRPAVGISVYLREFIEDLLGDRQAVTLVTSDRGHARWLADTFPDAEVDLVPERRSVVWEQLALPRYLRDARPDVYLAGGNRGLPLWSPPSTRLVLIVHDLIPLRMPRTYLLGDPLSAWRFLSGTAVSFTKADLVIANSHSTAADVRRLMGRTPVVVRYPSPPATPPPAGALPADWPEEFLLHCGGADPRKNVGALLAAHRRYRDDGGSLALVVLGAGFDGLRETVADRTDVVFSGVVSEATKWSALHRARAVVYPSTWEGFGLPILEALAVGTPVLAGHGGAQPEVGGEAAMYVDPHDPGQLTDALRRVAEPSWREHVRHSGPRRLRAIRESHTSALRCLEPVIGTRW